MAHYQEPERREQFDRAIEAAVVWIDACSEDSSVPMPPPALLGALGQALAIPDINRGERILNTIRNFMSAHAVSQEGEFAIEIVSDLRHRVDALLQGWELVAGEELAKRKTALEKLESLVTTLANVNVPSDIIRELQRIETGLKNLRLTLGEPG